MPNQTLTIDSDTGAIVNQIMPVGLVTTSQMTAAIAAAGTSPGGGATGTTTVNFGAFPGSTDTSVAVTGQASITAGSIVRATKRLVATADHSADEHFVEELDIEAGNISAGTGFTIYAKTRNRRLHGQWTVAWSWS